MQVFVLTSWGGNWQDGGDERRRRLCSQVKSRGCSALSTTRAFLYRKKGRANSTCCEILSDSVPTASPPLCAGSRAARPQGAISIVPSIRQGAETVSLNHGSYPTAVPPSPRLFELIQTRGHIHQLWQSPAQVLQRDEMDAMFPTACAQVQRTAAHLPQSVSRRPNSVRNGCAPQQSVSISGMRGPLMRQPSSNLKTGRRRLKLGGLVPLALGAHQEEARQTHDRLFSGLDYQRVFTAAEANSREVGDKLPKGEWFYGEFTFESFAAVIDQVAPAPGSVFVDLGSGCGKALFAAALSFPEFSECRGVEFLPALHEQAREVLHAYEVHAASAPCQLPRVSLECEDMFYSNVWMDADLVYCFATVLGPASQQLLQMRVEDMKSGGRCLVVSKRFTSPILKEVAVLELEMTHNREALPVFLYERM